MSRNHSSQTPHDDLDALQRELRRDFHDLLGDFARVEAISTDDVLTALLPLMRQAAELHEAGLAAPLDGFEAIRTYRKRLFFGPGAGDKPRWNQLALSQIQGARDDGGAPPAPFAALERALEEEDPAKTLIAPRGRAPSKPLYLPDYRCWEHAIGNHDPLTDIYSLGMIGVSLATGLDFTEEDDLARYVAHRHRLGQLNPRLHPVVADVFTRMAALDRRNRVQDLATAIHALENHRQIAESARIAEGEAALGRDGEILKELRGRLYDLSRRNKLLFHKPSNLELNLSETSTPIVLHVDAIRPEQILTWAGDFAQRVSSGEKIALSEFIRFDEMTHAPAVLDKIRSQARKDKTEFGFSQLRLVLCFLRWRNLKDDPETSISSPLLLLPVDLKKRRGVRDSYDLTALSAEAEVNPTLRRYLKLLYDVDLPAMVDLKDPSAVDALHRSMSEQIARSEPGVKLEKRDKPDVKALHRRAQRRVDLHRTRNKPTGGQKRFGDVTYSYGRAQFRPLGVQLFHRFVAPPATPKRPTGPKAGAAALGLGGGRDGRQMSLPMDPDAIRQAATATKVAPESAAKEALTASDQRLWTLDLCAMTLANFNYRKMSLVRDFDALLDRGVGAPDSLATVSSVMGGGEAAFDKLFSDAPRPLTLEAPDTPHEARFPVVPSDPTQEAAVLRSRTGQSYVIQGPPGAGKSQTIANLIADYLGRGKRVLFVCEKRAAIDVVHQRLEALGLHRLCARVHDAQDDKKSFILDLKALFETWMEAPANETVHQRRREALAALQRGLADFEALDRDMTADADGDQFHRLALLAAAAAAPAPVGGVLEADGGAPLSSGLAARLDPAEAALLPDFAEWRAHRSAAHEVEEALRRVDGAAQPVLARHPARFVSAEASADPQLFERLTRALEALQPHLDRMKNAVELAVWAEDQAAPLSALFAQIDYAHRLRPIAEFNRLDVFDPDSGAAQRFRADQRLLDLCRKNVMEAEARTALWNDKLSPIETQTALGLARQHEGSFFGFLSSPWRTAKAEVAQRTGLAELSIKPTITQLLTDLDKEHEAAKELETQLRHAAGSLGLQDGEEAIRIVDEIDRDAPREGRDAEPLMALVKRDLNAAARQIRDLAALKPAADAARAALSACFEGLETLPVERAFKALEDLQRDREALPAFAPALRALAQAPDSVRTALRRIDAPIADIEAAILDRAVDRALAVRPAARESSGPRLDAAAVEVAAALSNLRRANAELLLEEARARFVEHLNLATRLELELDAEGQELRRKYLAARQDLDRELAKSTRYRSIRELMASDAGLLIQDLKPVWLMSPLSVGDVLPLESGLFDVAIFDEASQVPVEEAAPTLFRAPQAIVVGDEKQLPPTNFFGGGPVDAEIWDDVDGDDGAVGLELDADSFLAQAARTLPATLLGWHYRSRSEELIGFSNAAFYGGRLISVPSIEQLRPADPIVAADAAEGAEKWREVLDRPITWHRTPFGVYERQRNLGEASYVAELVRGLLLERTGRSIGVVAFSKAQQSEIERALEKLAKSDVSFRNLYEAELEREEDGQFVGLFVKNLENVQGDERDIIIVSVCYAADSTGRMRMNFGPINRAGGEKRLNVIFSRAKHHLALVSTISADAITNDYNTGALCLKSYLRYADGASRGDAEAMRRALTAVAPPAQIAATRAENPLAERIAGTLRERGWNVETQLGQSTLVCDLAVRRPDGDAGAPRSTPLAVLIDGPAHFASSDLLERHVVKPGVLSAFGWRTMTVLAIDWRRDPNRVIARIEAALDDS